MLLASICLFALSAVLGMSILIRWLLKKDASRGVIYSHGIVAAGALGILLLYALQHKDNFPKAALGLFILAAAGGFYMFIRDLNKKMSPMAIAFIHALFAVSGFVALLVFTFA